MDVEFTEIVDMVLAREQLAKKLKPPPRFTDLSPADHSAGDGCVLTVYGHPISYAMLVGNTSDYYTLMETSPAIHSHTVLLTSLEDVALWFSIWSRSARVMRPQHPVAILIGGSLRPDEDETYNLLVEYMLDRRIPFRSDKPQKVNRP